MAIMREDANIAAKYEIRNMMIKFEGIEWIETFKECISRGCLRGNYVAISNYADVLCSDDSKGFRHFISKI